MRPVLASLLCGVLGYWAGTTVSMRDDLHECIADLRGAREQLELASERLTVASEWLKRCELVSRAWWSTASECCKKR
jgi:hypothetical protein